MNDLICIVFMMIHKKAKYVCLALENIFFQSICYIPTWMTAYTTAAVVA
jgi:hypothetical protein